MQETQIQFEGTSLLIRSQSRIIYIYICLLLYKYDTYIYIHIYIHVCMCMAIHLGCNFWVHLTSIASWSTFRCGEVEVNLRALPRSSNFFIPWHMDPKFSDPKPNINPKSPNPKPYIHPKSPNPKPAYILNPLQPQTYIHPKPPKTLNLHTS